MAELNSNTVTVGQLFDRENFFRIPDYQRPFSWKMDNLTDLIDDLAAAPPDADYFLGTLVLHELKDKHEDDVSTYDIVDGQQRLTALCLLLACIRDSPAFGSDEDLQRQIQDKLHQKAQSLSGIPARVRLHVRELDSFTKIVGTLGGTQSDQDVQQIITPGEKRFRDAIDVFNKRLDQLPPADVVALATLILRRCVVICLAASTFEEAFRLFTVVNDRGLQLRRIDIIKANNLAPSVIINESVRAHYADKWEAMEEQVGSGIFEDIFHLLRLIYTQDKPKEDLFGEFEKRILGQPKRPKKGTDFLDTLREYVDLYDSLFIARDYLDGTKDSAKFATMMNAMVTHFGASEWQAVVLEFAHKYGKKHLYAFLLKIEKLYLVDWVGALRKDERYEHYTSLLKIIDVSKTPAPVLKAIDVDEAPVREGCLVKNFYTTGYSKYLLLRAEILASELTEARKFTIRSVEHVLPQNPAVASEWRRIFSQQDIDELVHSAGNLVLLSKSKNSSAQNKDFNEKKLSYLKPRVTDFPRSVQILNEKAWTRGVIERRGADFAKTVLTDP